MAKFAGLDPSYVPGSGGGKVSVSDYAKTIGNGKTKGMEQAVITAYEQLNADSIAAGYGPLDILSGYRSPEHNARVGGAKHSQHLHGRAIDFAGAKSWSPEKRAFVIQRARELGATGLGDYSSGAMQLDWRPGGRAWWGGGPTQKMWR